MGEFRLEAREFRSLARWRWLLTGPDGSMVADHEVRLNEGCWQFKAFSNLWDYVQLRAVPDRRMEDEALIVAEVGAWIGEHVFGEVGRAVVRARSATVRVIAPADAESLLFLPFELAHVAGKPLFAQGVTLVMQPGGDDGAPGVAPVGERLRVLGLFSQP
jgi:hypothetical protein